MARKYVKRAVALPDRWCQNCATKFVPRVNSQRFCRAECQRRYRDGGRQAKLPRIDMYCRHGDNRNSRVFLSANRVIGEDGSVWFMAQCPTCKVLLYKRVKSAAPAAALTAAA